GKAGAEGTIAEDHPVTRDDPRLWIVMERKPHAAGSARVARQCGNLSIGRHLSARDLFYHLINSLGKRGRHLVFLLEYSLDRMGQLMKKTLVIGSTVADVIVRVSHLPRTGEDLD